MDLGCGFGFEVWCLGLQALGVGGLVDRCRV